MYDFWADETGVRYQYPGHPQRSAVAVVSWCLLISCLFDWQHRSRGRRTSESSLWLGLAVGIAYAAVRLQPPT